MGRRACSWCFVLSPTSTPQYIPRVWCWLFFSSSSSIIVVGKTAPSQERVLKFRHVHVSGVRNIYINIFFEVDVLGLRFHAGKNDNKMILCEINITCNNAWEGARAQKKKRGWGGGLGVP